MSNRFELPIRAVRAALESVESLGDDAMSDEVFRAARRFSAAAGFLSRELHSADGAARFAQGLPIRSTGDMLIISEEAAAAETRAVEQMNPSPVIGEPPNEGQIPPVS